MSILTDWNNDTLNSFIINSFNSYINLFNNGKCSN